jgi:hypothetical protein
MRRDVGLVIGLLFLASASAFAEEAATEEEEARPEPRRQIRVLEDPYQISSFYRSNQSGRAGYFGGYALEPMDSRYPIAGFYRQDGGAGSGIASFYRHDGGRGGHPIAGFYRGEGGRHSRFWSLPLHGRGHRTRGRMHFRPVVAADLCLVAPTVLFPFAAFAR